MQSVNPNAKKRRAILLGAVVLLGSLAAAVALAREVDTLFLRDGSVLKGYVLEDGQGNYLVYSQHYGEVAVGTPEALYLVPKEESFPFLTESYILIDAASDVISTLQRDVPEREAETPAFNLLVPGAVDGIHDPGGAPVPFQSDPIGSLTKVTIRFDDLRAGIKKLSVTTRQKNLLSVDESGAMTFRVAYTLDEDGGIRVIVKHPREWKIQAATPAPSHQFEGLIVWETKLKRQQNFKPTITFHAAK